MSTNMSSRRKFLRQASFTALGAFLTACQPQAIEKTVEVIQEVEVEKTVEVEVERTVIATAAPEPIELQVWSHIQTESWQKVMDTIFTRFAELNPGMTKKISHIGFPNNEYKQSILPAAFAGGAPPDVFINHGFGWLFEYVKAEKIVDITEWFNTASSRYTKGAEVAFVYADKVWGAPYRIGATPFIFYNTDMLDEFGLSVQDLDTYENWMAACEVILATGTTPIAWGGKDKWPEIHYITNILKNILGPENATSLALQQYEPTELKWTSPEVIDAAQTLKDLYDKQYLGKNTVIEDFQVALNRFTAGESPMSGCYIGWARDFDAKMEEDPTFHANLVNFPALAAGPGKGTDWIFWGEGFSASNLEEKKLVGQLALMDYLGNTEAESIMYEGMPDIYACKETMASIQGAKPLLKRSLELYDQTTAFIPIADVAMDPASSTVLYDEIQGMLLGKRTVNEALETVQQAVEGAL